MSKSNELTPLKCDTVGCTEPATHTATANRENGSTYRVYHCGVHLGPTICNGPKHSVVFTDIKPI